MFEYLLTPLIRLLTAGYLVWGCHKRRPQIVSTFLPYPLSTIFHFLSTPYPQSRCLHCVDNVNIWKASTTTQPKITLKCHLIGPKINILIALYFNTNCLAYLQCSTTIVENNTDKCSELKHEHKRIKLLPELLSKCFI